jgi:hypothetical protein
LDQGNYAETETVISKCLFHTVEVSHQKSPILPVGDTGLEYGRDRLVFSSTSYEWLAVNQDPNKFHFKGMGMINGALDGNDNPYRFMLCAGDRTSGNGSNMFHIRIWSEGAGGVESVVYDNGVSQATDRGGIVVHLGKH